MRKYENIDFNDWNDEELEYDSPLTDKYFVKFLKDNDVYDKFIYNCNNNKSNKYYKKIYWKSLETFCTNIKEKYLYINHAFNWGETNEDHDFWNKVDNKWLKYLKFNENINLENKDNFWIKLNKKNKLHESIDFNDWDDEEEFEYDSPLTDKEFVKFLYDNNVYDKFIYNCEHDTSYNGRYWKSLKTFCKEIPIKDYILHSFSWLNIPEDVSFWRKINKKWLDYLNNINESMELNDEWEDEELDDEYTITGILKYILNNPDIIDEDNYENVFSIKYKNKTFIITMSMSTNTITISGLDTELKADASQEIIDMFNEALRISNEKYKLKNKKTRILRTFNDFFDL